MKFLLSRYLDAAGWRRTDGQEPGGRRWQELVTVARRSGELVDGQTVADPSTAAVVTPSGDVPYTGRYLAEYCLVDCESRDRALELAALAPGGVEVRPVMDAAGMEM